MQDCIEIVMLDLRRTDPLSSTSIEAIEEDIPPIFGLGDGGAF
jgi:hypothetical protein